MQCPKCSAQMEIMERYKVDVDYYPSCNGAWLDRGEIDKIVKIQRSYEDNIITNTTGKGVITKATFERLHTIDIKSLFAQLY